MTIATWVFIVWLCALAYAMVGALVYRVRVPKKPTPLTQEEYYILAWTWPAYIIFLAGRSVLNALIYIPFRAAIRAIVRPTGEERE